MSFEEGQWMHNTADDGSWNSVEYFNTKLAAIEAGNHEYSGDYKNFYVGQISPMILNYGVDTEDIFNRISENVYDKVGEGSEDYLSDIKAEHDKILEDRLNKVLFDWMDEFDYRPSFFKIINTEMINTADLPEEKPYFHDPDDGLPF